MARAKQDLEGELIFNSLTSWKSLHKISSDPYVEGLLSSLEEKKDLEIWATLNPLEYLPHAQVEPNQRWQSALFILSIIRNSLVFSPVALTWLAISKATAAFSAYTADNSLTVVNFLEFWENGYGVLAKRWSLSSVATLDFQIILAIIALTVFLGIFERRVKNLRSQDTIAADNDRVQMALEISRYLYSQQRPTAAVVNASTASILRNLVSASKSMEQTSKELNKSVKALPSHKDLLTEIKKMKARLFLGEK
jgi:hypothetical protein